MITQKDSIFKYFLEKLTLVKLNIVVKYNEQHTRLIYGIEFPKMYLENQPLISICDLFDGPIRISIYNIIDRLLVERLADLPNYYMELGDDIILNKVKQDLKVLEECQLAQGLLPINEELAKRLLNYFDWREYEVFRN